jgi:hypothetical protein
MGSVPLRRDYVQAFLVNEIHDEIGPMSTMNIVILVMLLVTVLAAADMSAFFWRRYTMRRREVSISKHLRQAIDEMGPFPEMPEPEVTGESRLSDCQTVG